MKVMRKNVPTAVQVSNGGYGPGPMDLECMVKVGPSDVLMAWICPRGLEGPGGSE